MNNVCILLICLVLIIYLINCSYCINHLSTPLRIAILIVYDSKVTRWKNEAEIWKKYMNKNSNIDCFFIECTGETRIETNYMGASCERNQSVAMDIFQKTILTLELLNGYDFYIRTNLNTFIIFNHLISQLNKLPKDIPVYAGLVFPVAGIHAISGTTIILNDKAKQALTTLGKEKDAFYKKIDTSQWIMEDVYIGHLLKTIGIEPIDIKHIRYDWDYSLEYNNNIAKINNAPFIRLKTENRDKYNKVAELLINKFYI